ncbi:hypothetical protein OHV05_24515 [Kitasatospora sp. NBC_00070]|uniref:hypothetical protein n=1 Tax=Kitasatospora sp. NBC_00070 TaxID=2975962 RepID=UPI003253D917
MTVIRLLYRDELEGNRQVICDWLTANHIDPCDVDPAWVSIETYAGSKIIRWKAIKRTVEGRALVDPDDPNRHWVVECHNSLIVELDLPLSARPAPRTAGGLA